jgi:hypothetical protein
VKAKPDPQYVKLRAVPEAEPEPKGNPMAHPFIIDSIVIKDKRGKIVKHVNPRQWARYGWEKKK